MQLLSTERADRKNDLLSLQDTNSQLERSLQYEQQAAGGKIQIFYLFFLGCRPQLEDENYLIFPHSVLRSEIRDLHLVLQSSDKELATVKEELHAVHSKQQNEMSQLSNSLISTQLQLDKVQ